MARDVATSPRTLSSAARSSAATLSLKCPFVLALAAPLDHVYLVADRLVLVSLRHPPPAASRVRVDVPPAEPQRRAAAAAGRRFRRPCRGQLVAAAGDQAGCVARGEQQR